MRSTAVASLLLVTLAALPHAADPETVPADEQTLSAAKLGHDGPALLDFFQKQILTDADRATVARLLGQLGDEDFAARDKASTDLVALGPKILALVRPAVKDADLEVARRAQDCVRLLEDADRTPAAGAAVPLAAVRLLAVRKPAATAEVLLAYLPFADRDNLIDEIQTTLAAVAVRGGKADPAVLAALTARAALPRAVAGAALAQAAAADHAQALRALLQDPDLAVRLRVGLALAAARDRAAIPPLIDLLGRLPADQTWQVEDVLLRLAGDKAPPAPAQRDAWTAWWRDHGPKVDLAALSAAPPHLGYTLLAAPDSGTVFELDRDQKVRWQVTGLQSPFDAQMLPGGRVLIAEYGGRVTERKLSGEVLWQKAIPSAMQAQRLANGATFVVTTRDLLEIDAAGKQTILHAHAAQGSIVVARKLRTGHVITIDSNGTCLKLDAAGKEVSRFAVGRISNNCLDVLPSGNVVVPHYFEGKVTEYDTQGKVVWEVPCPSCFCAQRLPNGNTLVTCHQPAHVVELDRQGKEVWKYDAGAANYRPWFANRR
jgi:hypothetical protein